MRKLVFLLLVVLLVLSLNAEELKSGDPAIDFTAVDTSGNTIKLSDFYDKVILLDFWGTWCGPCKKEIPNLIDIKNWLKNTTSILFPTCLLLKRAKLSLFT